MGAGVGQQQRPPPHPELPLRADEWLSRADIRALGPAARGIQVDLLCYAWRDGSIPAAPAALARMVGMAPAEFASLWQLVRPLWHEEDVGGTAVLKHPGLEATRASHRQARRRRRERAKKAARSRWNEADAGAPKPGPKRQRKVAAPGQKAGDYGPEFLEFWQVYPPRTGNNPKKGAHMRWLATCRRGTPPAELVAAARRYRAHCDAAGKTGTEYVMMAETFLGPREPWRSDWTPPPGKGRRNGTLDLRQLRTGE